MSATISKSMSWTLDPILLFLAILILVTVFASEKRLTLYLLLIILSFGVLSITPLPEMLMENLERQEAGSREISFKEYAIVLGGDNVHFIKNRNQFNYAESFERVGEALRLYREKRISKIILTGGNVVYDGQIVNEAKSASAWLEAMGVPAADLITEEKSRSTYENALFVKEIVDGRQITDFYLVTSASHMRRSLGVFRKLGMNPTPYAVDFHALPSKKVSWNALGLAKLNLLKAAVHEYAGIVYYAVLGYL